MIFELPKPGGYSADSSTGATENWRRFRDKRGTAGIYQSSQWKKLRNQKLDETPLCELCERIATEVHHIHTDRKLFFVIDNLAAICGECHTKVSRAYAARKSKADLFGARGTAEYRASLLDRFA